MTFKSRPASELLGRLALIAGLVCLGITIWTIKNPGGSQSKTISTQYREVHQATLELRAMLEAYYGGPGILLNTWYVTPTHPAYRPAQEALANKVARALVWRDKFVIGATGSSVTAGLNNCFQDTYTEQLQRLMGPVWSAAGVTFEVRNAGQSGGCGGSFDNQVWCVETLAGGDADITHFSWHYFEAGIKPEYVQANHELFYRWSLLLPGNAIPQMVIPNDCGRMKQTVREMLEVYAPLGADALCMTKGMHAAGYPAVKPGEVGDGLHTTTREGEADNVSRERRDSLGVVFRNWHPGPLLFQTTADALAYKLSGAILLALEWIQAEREPRKRWPQQTRQWLPEQLPPPVACREEWCSAPRPPSCTLYQKPTFGRQAFQRLETSTDAVNPWHMQAGVDPTVYIPEAERELEQCRLRSRCDGLVAADYTRPARLSYTLPDLKLGHVAVCCGRKKCGEIMLEAGVEFLIDKQPPAQPPERFGISSGKCVLVQSAFEQPGNGPRTITLDILVPALEEKLPPISHVIGL